MGHELPRTASKDNGAAPRTSRRKGSWWSALSVNLSRRGSGRRSLPRGNKQRGTSRPAQDMDRAFPGDGAFEAYGGKSGRGSHAFECASPLFESDQASLASTSSASSFSSMDTRTAERGDVVKRVQMPPRKLSANMHGSDSTPKLRNADESSGTKVSPALSSSPSASKTIERATSTASSSRLDTPEFAQRSAHQISSAQNNLDTLVVRDTGLTRSERYELIHFLRNRDTKLKDETALLNKVDKLAKYPRKDLVVALTRLYGDVPASLCKMRQMLPCVEEERDGSWTTSSVA